MKDVSFTKFVAFLVQIKKFIWSATWTNNEWLIFYKPNGEMNCYMVVMFFLCSTGALNFIMGRRGCDHMVVEFTTTYAISAYHH